MTTIGVRELRQHASRWLARVARGESFEITDRGRPVARLVPMPSGSDRDALIAAGVLIPAADPGDLLDVQPLAPRDDGASLSQVLADLRADER